MKRRSLLAALGGMPAAPALLRGAAGAPSLPGILRAPDYVDAFVEKNVRHALEHHGSRWTHKDIEVTTEPGQGALPVVISAPRSRLVRVRLRWNGAVRQDARFLADHWERSYGDLEWRGHVADRRMPWYFLAHAEGTTRGVGVKTGAAAIASWEVDVAGITLWLDVQNGGSGVELGERKLAAATVVAVSGESGDSALDVTRRLCRAMCDKPRLPAQPVYGSNNWYYTYGRNLTAEALLRDTDLTVELAPPSSRNRPFMVLDMGWEEAEDGAGPTNRTNRGFPDMAALAAEMKKRGARPGIWLRPLLTVEKLPDAWLLHGKQAAGGIKPPFKVIDPSVPEALAHVGESVRILEEWGFDLIKHDYTTFDLTGKWGFQMTTELSEPGWNFSDRSRTTAEIVRSLYQAIRDSAPKAELIGCNTIGHLGAGLFEMQRIGDDTSGREWSRTRRMGVNTLAFRLAQHGTFFGADADCVPVTAEIPWDLTRQWLDVVVRSATPLFVSADPAIVGEREKKALKAAFAFAAAPQKSAEPLDWMETTVPARWRGPAGIAEYKWYADEG
jgi:alpha-galactosidase